MTPKPPRGTQYKGMFPWQLPKPVEVNIHEVTRSRGNLSVIHSLFGYGSIPIDTFKWDEHPFTSYFGVH